MRDAIIADIKRYFAVSELVCDHTYERWREASWQFLDTAFLHALLVIRRDILKAPMVCNTKTAHQRGLRCNMCPLVAEKASVYISAHILGKACDFTVLGMSAQEARDLIKQNAHLLPGPIRMEADVHWLHIDVLPQYNIKTKVYEFQV